MTIDNLFEKIHDLMSSIEVAGNHFVQDEDSIYHLDISKDCLHNIMINGQIYQAGKPMKFHMSVEFDGGGIMTSEDDIVHIIMVNIKITGDGELEISESVNFKEDMSESDIDHEIEYLQNAILRCIKCVAG